MSRSKTCTALVLQVRQSGEQNREAVFLSREEGILKATLFGGPKSKLRAYVSPFHEGILWYYEDPVRNTKKITDFDVRHWRPALRESYAHLMAGSALLEIVLASQGSGGPWQEAFTLLSETLETLSTIQEAGIPVIVTYFIWNWLKVLGLLPELEHCQNCACNVRPDEVVWYSSLEQQAYCSSCGEPIQRTERERLFPINGGGRRWVARILELPASQVERYRVDEQTLAQVQRLGTELLQQALSRPISYGDTLNSRRSYL
ncbi:MAG: DNA repair protein RecO [Treponema sp.]|nr:DNA repair protein RecO [Treponema sp.]